MVLRPKWSGDRILPEDSLFSRSSAACCTAREEKERLVNVDQCIDTVKQRLDNDCHAIKNVGWVLGFLSPNLSKLFVWIYLRRLFSLHLLMHFRCFLLGCYSNLRDDATICGYLQKPTLSLTHITAGADLCPCGRSDRKPHWSHTKSTLKPLNLLYSLPLKFNFKSNLNEMNEMNEKKINESNL